MVFAELAFESVFSFIVISFIIDFIIDFCLLAINWGKIMKIAPFILKTRHRSRRGFTLLQILLVLAIVALLSAFLFGAFGHSR